MIQMQRTTGQGYESVLLTRKNPWKQIKNSRHSGARSALEMAPSVKQVVLSNKQVEEAAYLMKMNIVNASPSKQVLNLQRLQGAMEDEEDKEVDKDKIIQLIGIIGGNE